MQWIYDTCTPPCEASRERALERQNTLTKPTGSLGQLEEIAIDFAGWQRTPYPELERLVIRVFAADHGVAAQGVSAFPQAVTTQMVLNFLSGGAAIAVLAKKLSADFCVINVGTAHPMADQANLRNLQIRNGSRDFTQEAAMSDAELDAALRGGREQIETNQSELFIGGEMGIGNTTSASALYAALLKLDPEKTVGPGTGIDDEQIHHKINVVAQGLALHQSHLTSPIDVLRRLGGLEIAALVGAYITAAKQQTPVLVDGFICTAAALIASKLNPSVRPWMMFAHQSAEPAHQIALHALNAKPLLNLGMRLGEGSGAATAVSLLKTALNLHNEMATFNDAGVSNRAG